MPTITVSRNELVHLAHLPEQTSLAELEQLLDLVKGELNGRTADGVVLRTREGVWSNPGGDLALRIELKDTNRPDLWCVEGIARQLRSQQRGHGDRYDFYSAAPGDLVIEVDPALEAVRPFIGGFLATGAVLDEAGLLALIAAQETLTFNFGRRRSTVSVGFYRGDAIAFPLHYRAVALDEGAFEPLAPAGDPAWQTGVAMTPAEILKRHPTGQEYAWIMEGWRVAPRFTDAHGRVFSFPPIINSADLGRVAPGDRALLVEATATDQRQGLLTLAILAANLADRGWTITPLASRYPYDTPLGRTVMAPQALPMTQRAAVADFSRLLGDAATAPEIVARLTAYGVQAEEAGGVITATVGGYRQDYLHAVDVIEDFAISRGYAAFTPILPAEFTVGRFDPLTELEDLVRDLMIGFGFEEAICNILGSVENLRGRMNLDGAALVGAPPFHGGPLVRIGNVMSRSYEALRDWILPSLLEIESQSIGAAYPHQIFEVGEVAVHDPHANLGSRTESRLGVLLASEQVSFDAAQSVLYALLGSLSLPFRVTPWAHPSFIAGRVALITAEAKGDAAPLGFVGELSPQVIAHWGTRVPLAAAELSLQALARCRLK